MNISNNFQDKYLSDNEKSRGPSLEERRARARAIKESYLKYTKTVLNQSKGKSLALASGSNIGNNVNTLV